jgi:pimeloyl-ACP methyl ester carboxylesterase
MSVDLQYDRIDGAAPERAIAFLHGILGRGLNLRSIARKFVEARPHWSAVLVDLRGHGRSPKGTPAPSIEAAARDVLDLASRTKPLLGSIVGHSFGGKVALEAARLGGMATPEHLVLIDSAAGPRTNLRGSGSPLDIIETLESLPSTFASRNSFVDAVIAAGKPRAIAQWLAQSLEPEGDHVRFGLDLGEIRVLLSDYSIRDLWPVVESPPGSSRVHLVIAEKSDSYSPEDRTRAARLSETSERVTVDVLPAGHWVHVDDPDGLLRVLLTRIP